MLFFWDLERKPNYGAPNHNGSARPGRQLKALMKKEKKERRQRQIEEEKIHEACQEDVCEVSATHSCPIVQLFVAVPENYPPMEEFQFEKLKFLLATLVDQSKYKKMQIDLYTTLYDEFLKLFLHFGKAIKLAFADIQQKADQIRQGQKNITTTYSLDKASDGSKEHEASIYVEQLILWEVQEELVMMNGDNNSEIIEQRRRRGGMKEDKWMKSYVSVGYVVVRGAWFFDYLESTLECLYYRRHMQCSEVAIHAYDAALARHHPWFLQKGAKLGMRLATSRANFLNNLLEEQSKVSGKPYTEAMAYDDIAYCHRNMKHLAAHLWTFFRGQGLEEIP